MATNFFNLDYGSLKLIDHDHRPTQQNDDDPLEKAMFQLKKDLFVNQYAAQNKFQKLVNYLWIENVVPFYEIQQYIIRQMTTFKAAHKKNLSQAQGYCKTAHDCFLKTYFNSAIQHFGLVRSQHFLFIFDNF